MFLSTLVITLALAESSIAHAWNTIPRTGSIIVQEHVRARAALTSLERRPRQDQPFRATLSAVAKKADAIVHAIRTDRFAGQIFPSARPCISETQFWKIVKRYPKGALLHTHLMAMLPFEALLETVVHTEGMSIYASQNVATEGGRWNASITFSHHNTTILEGLSIDSFFYMFASLVDDGISWMEIRIGYASGMLVHQGDESPNPDLEFWWQVMKEEITRFQATEKGKDFLGARVIWSDYRGNGQASLIESMKTALGRNVEFPELFSGYDVIGREELGRTLTNMTPELLWFQDQAADMTLLLSTRRIGHGFSLYKHPELTKKVIESAMIAHSITTAISNDDPAILGQDAAGVSYDLYQVVQGFENIGLAGLGARTHNSIRWSNFEDQSDEDDGVKAKRLQA
ncbi:hypothetical protein EDB81DRAFT_840058 [Dactylonectria macrodidyma]|uniref:Adenosine deaminase domain-containing protein n=1 Tax=Dactylonectria macrodidyma TaxID=307937 RepID=A0A9P9JHM6_9HYPO|nr:hypothetical protein EDB81DRAFT_840058 [Dactylonectria macrodidyma]